MSRQGEILRYETTQSWEKVATPNKRFRVGYYIQWGTGRKYLNDLSHENKFMDYLPEGSPAPDFELSTPDGVRLRLSDALISGGVALAFYKSSCPTCQFTFPFIQRLFASFPHGSLPTVWGISQDEVEPTEEFITEHQLTFPVLIDEHPYPVSTAYELHFVPTVYLVDRDQSVRIADFGFSKPVLRALAERLAEEADSPVPILFSDADGLPERRPG